LGLDAEPEFARQARAGRDGALGLRHDAMLPRQCGPDALIGASQRLPNQPGTRGMPHAPQDFLGYLIDLGQGPPVQARDFLDSAALSVKTIEHGNEFLFGLAYRAERFRYPIHDLTLADCSRLDDADPLEAFLKRGRLQLGGQLEHGFLRDDSLPLRVAGHTDIEGNVEK
jgi:hypothetical protein